MSTPKASYPPRWHTFADDGTYSVTVTVRDDDGEEDRGTFQVVVSNVAPRATIEPCRRCWRKAVR